MQHPSGDAQATLGRTAPIIASVSGLLALALRPYSVTHAEALQAADRDAVRGVATQAYGDASILQSQPERPVPLNGTEILLSAVVAFDLACWARAPWKKAHNL